MRNSNSQAAPPPPAGIDTTTAALGLAAVTIVGAGVVGILAGVSAALLVFVTGALLGAILLVWHSLRTLAGDAEVDNALETATARTSLDLADKKLRALRALKDLEQEHELGKIDDKDYATLSAEYRAQAKDVIREMDDVIAPYREKAEALVRARIEKNEKNKPAPAAETDHACPKCKTKNDADATFCKKCGEKLAS